MTTNAGQIAAVCSCVYHGSLVKIIVFLLQIDYSGAEMLSV